MSDLAVVKPQPAELTTGEAFLSIVAAAASNPQMDVDKMQALLDMQERIMKHQAEVEFNRAMRAAQEEMRPITRDAWNEQTKSKYARLETIDAKIRPIYTRHGFSLSFSSGAPRIEGNIRVLCHVAHSAGHSEDKELESGLDVAGPKGNANKTPMHGLGSSVSYLRRYLKCMIFDITLTNEDDDGNGGRNKSELTDEQLDELQRTFELCELSDTRKQAFFEHVGGTSIATIPVYNYGLALTQLRGVLRKKQESGQ